VHIYIEIKFGFN